MSERNNDWVMPVVVIGGGLVMLGGLKKFFQMLGLADDKKDTENETLFGYMAAFDPKFWKSFPAGTQVMLITQDRRKALAQKIYDAHAFFNDNEEMVYGVFQQMKTKSMVSYMADYFFQRYNKSLIDYLRDFLSDGELNRVFQIVNPLPARMP